MSGTGDTATSGSSGGLVAVIDDVALNRLVLQRLLEASGYAFAGAATGAEGLALLREAVPRLVLLDVQLPDMDGFEVCRALRGMPHLAAVPVVFFTAGRTAQDERMGREAGGDGFIAKPFEPAGLLERVRHWTGRAR